MLEERAADALRDRAVDLSLDDQRVDDAAGILHAHVAPDRDGARREIHLDRRRLRARRERAPDRIVEARGVEAGLGVRRQPVRLEERDARDLGKRDDASGRALDRHAGLGDIQVVR